MKYRTLSINVMESLTVYGIWSKDGHVWLQTLGVVTVGLRLDGKPVSLCCLFCNRWF